MDASIAAMQSAGDLAMSRSMPLHAGGAKTDAQMDKASKDFESMFMSQMMQPMLQSVTVNETFGGGHGEEMMRGLLVQEYGKIAGGSGRMGIAAAVKQEMIRAQAAETGKGTSPSSDFSAASAAPSPQAASAGANDDAIN